MKKELLFMATAALTISSCTMQEVDDVAATQKEPIQFEQFIGKATRAGDVTTTTLTEFKVLGKKYSSNGQSAGSFDITVTKSGSGWTYSPTMYWEEGVKYCFTAINLTEYAYGMIMFESNSATDYGLNGSLFQLAGTNLPGDVVAAVCPAAIEGKASGNEAVSFNFKHILTKVQVTFVNELDELDLMFESAEITQAQGTSNFRWENTGQPTWDNYSMTGTYPLDADYPFNLPNGESKTYTLYLLPQAQEDFQPQLNCEYISEDSPAIKDGHIALDLFNDNVTKWEAGKAYNYKITFAPKTVEPEEVQFTVSIDSWGSADDVDLDNVEISEN